MFAPTRAESKMSESPEHHQDQSGVQTYQVRLRGHLDPRWAARLEVPSLTQESDGTTTLGGIAVDQAALHGLLQRVRDLGLTLVAVALLATYTALSIIWSLAPPTRAGVT